MLQKEMERDVSEKDYRRDGFHARHVLCNGPSCSPRVVPILWGGGISR